jgi:hypothetical protein
METLIALSLLLASGDPALAGGPLADDPRERIEHLDDRRTVPPVYGRGERARTDDAVRAGDPVRLNASFFATPLAGGVERPASLRIYSGRGVIVIAPGATAPVSAGQAAAALGLPRG